MTPQPLHPRTTAAPALDYARGVDSPDPGASERRIVRMGLTSFAAVLACLAWVYLGIPVLDRTGVLPRGAARYGAGENLRYALVLVPAAAAAGVLVLFASVILYGVVRKRWRAELCVFPMLALAFAALALGLEAAWRRLP